MGDYVTFLLNLAGDGEDRTIASSVGALDAVPANAFQWRVICDAEGKIFLIALDGKRTEVIAMAELRESKIVMRRVLEHERGPTEFQWKLVEDALHANLANAKPDATVVEVNDIIKAHRPKKKGVRYVEPPPELPSDIATRPRPPSPHRWIWAMVGSTLAGAAIYVLVRLMTGGTPPPPPPLDLIAHASAMMRWSDVAGAAETTFARVEKDWEAERGKKLCVHGVIESIERRDVQRRKTFVGRFVTDEGDRVEFVAVGSTGDLVRQRQATLCGVVTGKRSVLGMFDVPENQLPVVEQ